MTDPATWARATPNGEARFSFASLVPDRDRIGQLPGPLHVIVQHHDKDLVVASSHQPNSVAAIVGYRTAARMVSALDLSVDSAGLAEITAPVETVIVRADDPEMFASALTSVGIQPAHSPNPLLPEEVAVLDARALLGVLIEVHT